MKKILLLLVLVGNVAFAQKLTKDQLSDKLAEKACECTEKQELTKENFELTIGICLIEGINAYEKDVEKLKVIVTAEIEAEPMASIDYVDLFSFPDLEPIETVSGESLLAIAVRIGKTRLIDNIILK